MIRSASRQPAHSSHPSLRARAGYTLIELLVVMAIISILVGMLAAAVFNLLGKGPALAATKEIREMSAQLVAFQTRFKVDTPPPSRLLLREDGDYTPASNLGNEELADDSKKYLKKMFPNCSLIGMDWNGNGTFGETGSVTLDGPRCLVFFLGGINGVKGFSTNSANPTDGRTERFDHYRFEPARLTQEAFPAYNDPWLNTPYAYFSSYKGKNGYNRYGNTDCAGLDPYYESVGENLALVYVHPETFQIISAGPDTTFGPGGLWGRANPAAGAGADDISNFHKTRLGYTR